MIPRYAMAPLNSLFVEDIAHPKGLIVSGIVGCGKTTLIKTFLAEPAVQRQVFLFTGDDVAFRVAVASDSRYLVDHIRASTQMPPLVFIDEVQKVEAVFDAVKLVFDELDGSFIVSGSNPLFLETKARQRLQRRATSLELRPLSLPEILAEAGHFDLEKTQKAFSHILCDESRCKVPNLGITVDGPILDAARRYLRIGGLPLAWLARSEAKSMKEVQNIVERGFEPMHVNTQNVSDVVRIELAKQHCREFTYQGVMKRTGIRSRDQINRIIDELKGHGYLLERRPLFPRDDRRSYLVNYSWVDPGIVSYLAGFPASDEDLGFRVEGLAQVRIDEHLQSSPIKSELGYFKPYTVDANDKTKFLPGEIDMLARIGKRLVPIEVKLTNDPKAIDTKVIDGFVQEHMLPFGIILYGGSPFADVRGKKIYWPWWLV